MVKAAWRSACLRRRSLAGELSLMPDLWSTDDHFVDKVSAVGQLSTNQSNSAFHPSGIGLVSSNPCNYMDYGGGNIKTGRSELRMASENRPYISC